MWNLSLVQDLGKVLKRNILTVKKGVSGQTRLSITVSPGHSLSSLTLRTTVTNVKKSGKLGWESRNSPCFSVISNLPSVENNQVEI